MLKKLQALSALAFVFVLGCSTPTKQTPPFKAKSEKAVSIMTWNVENLFDTIHDEGKNDYQYLPLSFKKGNLDVTAACEIINKDEKDDYRLNQCLNDDWTPEMLDLKMKRLADVVLSAPGNGPDILMVQEVENLRVLSEWNQKYLQAAGYQTVALIEGQDERGIDVGILSKFPLAGKPKLHQIKFSPDSKEKDGKPPKTRGILEVPLKLPNGETLYAMSFHFPSQGSPVELRKDAIATLNNLIKKRSKKHLVIAAGDSNIPAKEDAYHGLFKTTANQYWKISHFIGCKTCEGTYNYRGEWSFLDVMLFSPNLTDGKASYQVALESMMVPKASRYQLRQDGTPNRFNDRGSGVADHLPLYVELVPRKAP